MTIKAVIFDLWETLITDTPEAALLQERERLNRIEEILVAQGHATAAEEIEQAYRALWHRCHELYWSRDVDVPTRVQIEHFLDGLGISQAHFDEDTMRDLEVAYSEALLVSPPELVEGAGVVLEELSARGMRMGIVSNTGRTPGYALRRVLEAREVWHLISAAAFSNEFGACKPDPSIFRRVLEDLSVEPPETVFVGDNEYCDVWGAQQLGMKGVHFIPARRGLAVAAPVQHGLTIVPDAVIRSLRELPDVIGSLGR